MPVSFLLLEHSQRRGQLSLCDAIQEKVLSPHSSALRPLLLPRSAGSPQRKAYADAAGSLDAIKMRTKIGQAKRVDYGCGEMVERARL